jgi:4-hydroxy 2-oxovalerate aldolase
MVSILDCTFRDGGYYTNWDFDHDAVDTYLDSVSRLPIDVIEIGYCNHPMPGYFGKYWFLDRFELERARKLLRPDQKLAVMLDAKSCEVERLDELLSDCVGVVDIVRMAVAPKQLDHGIALARKLKSMGFGVGFNVMYLSSYADDVKKISALAGAKDVIDSVALVDSYGSCTPDQVTQAIKATCAMLPGTQIGFHGHDNICLAFANTLSAIDGGAVMVDGTFVGMGRGAGNLKTEMMLIHKANQTRKGLDYDALARVVHIFEDLQGRYGWGTNLAYMISGVASLPQKNVMDWLGKNRYSVPAIIRALHQESNQHLDETVYPPLRLNEVLKGDEILIVGGGESVSSNLAAIGRFIDHDNPLVIHSSTRHLGHLDAFGTRQLVCLAGSGAARLPEHLDIDRIASFVVQEGPRFPGDVPADLQRPIVQVMPFASTDEPQSLGPVSDFGPLSLALGAAKALGVRRISLVGFDGYDHANVAQQELGREIQSALDRFRRNNAGIEVESLTPTLYQVPQSSVYGRLASRH